MSDSRDIELIKDPGLPEHVHRSTDIDPKAAKRAERQIAILFGLSALGTLLLIYSYIFVSDETFIFIPVLGETNAHQFGLGMGMAIALFCIGAGAIHWAKTLMPDEEVIAQRHEFRSPDEDRAEFVKKVKEGPAARPLPQLALTVDDEGYLVAKAPFSEPVGPSFWERNS